MKFNLQLPTDRVKFREQFGTAEAVMEMSNAAETHGYDAVFVTEHPIPQDEWMRTGGHHALDPFVALSFAAAGTRTLRLQTNLCVIPYRNPFITAKAVATLRLAPAPSAARALSSASRASTRSRRSSGSTPCSRSTISAFSYAVSTGIRL